MQTEATPLAMVNNLRDKISERIREQFVELIPDEHWKALVDAEIKRFTERDRDYNRKEIPSALERLIQDALAEQFREHIKTELAKPEYQKQWGEGEYSAGEFVSVFLQKHADSLIKSVFGNVVQQAVDKLRHADF